MKKVLLTIAVCLAMTGCSRGGSGTNNASANAAAEAARPAGIAGDWTSATAVTNEEDDMSMKITNLRYTYFSDNKVSYSGEVSLSGARLPNSMHFKITGEGTYLLEGKVLREDMVKVSVTASDNGATEQAIAKQLEKNLLKEPSSVHDVLELSASKLRLRARDSGRILELTRAAT